MLKPSTVEVALFDSLAFVVFFLSLAESDDELDMATAGEEFNGDDSETGSFLFFESEDLFFGCEKTEIAGGIRAESEIIEPEFVIPNGDERTFQSDMMVANQANFGSREGETDG